MKCANNVDNQRNAAVRHGRLLLASPSRCDWPCNILSFCKSMGGGSTTLRTFYVLDQKYLLMMPKSLAECSRTKGSLCLRNMLYWFLFILTLKVSVNLAS